MMFAIVFSKEPGPCEVYCRPGHQDTVVAQVGSDMEAASRAPRVMLTEACRFECLAKAGG
jgi:hypothetical protein